MRILTLNCFDRDGGAARSARRLHWALRGQGVDSRMLVLHQSGDDTHTHLSQHPIHRRFGEQLPWLDALPLALYRKRDVTHWSNSFCPASLEKQIRELDPDLLHLHWVNRGLIGPAEMKRWGKPIVWTLHDFWPFTGGCHYPAMGCEGFKQRCGRCPALGSSSERDLSRWNWQRKQKAWQQLRLQILAPSTWLTQQAAASSLFAEQDCRCLPNAIDPELYKPGLRSAVRRELGLPEDKALILMVAMNPDADRNKGGALALEAVRLAAEQLGPDAAELVIAGESDGPDKPQTPWKVHRMGFIQEEQDMVKLYQAADLQVVPSYFENLSNAIMEACSCAIPCVAFDSGGNRDMVIDGKTGLLATPWEPGSLAQGMQQLIQNPELRQQLGQQAREHILHFSEQQLIAQRHIALYEELLQRS